MMRESDYTNEFRSLTAQSTIDAKSEYWARLTVSSHTGRETEADVLLHRCNRAHSCLMIVGKPA